MTRENRAIAVYGAAGRTGRYVLAEIRRRGFEAIAVGRDGAKLPSSGRVTRVDDAASLDAALSDADVVINCAGPFLDTAFPVVDAALRGGIPYLDISAEQASSRMLFETRGDAAREAGIKVVPSTAFFGGLADLLASAAANGAAHLDEIRVALGLDSWRPTEGTRRTGRRNTAARLIQSGGRLVPIPTPAPSARWNFPAPLGSRDVMMLPFSETILLTSHLSAEAVESWINLEPIRDIRDPATPPPDDADALGRSSQRFIIDVTVRQGSSAARATASGVDIYHISAPIVVEAAARILGGEAGRTTGVFAPGALFDARDFLASLDVDSFNVTFVSNSEPTLEREMIHV